MRGPRGIERGRISRRTGVAAAAAALAILGAPALASALDSGGDLPGEPGHPGTGSGATGGAGEAGSFGTGTLILRLYVTSGALTIDERRFKAQASAIGERNCTGPLVRARVGGRDRRKLDTVDFLLNGRQAGEERSFPFAETFELGRRLRNRITARVVAIDGRRVSLRSHRFRPCRR
jgi:hypothetical protein